MRLSRGCSLQSLSDKLAVGSGRSEWFLVLAISGRLRLDFRFFVGLVLGELYRFT